VEGGREGGKGGMSEGERNKRRKVSNVETVVRGQREDIVTLLDIRSKTLPSLLMLEDSSQSEKKESKCN